MRPACLCQLTLCGVLLVASAWVPAVVRARQGLDTLPHIGLWERVQYRRLIPLDWVRQ